MRSKSVFCLLLLFIVSGSYASTKVWHDRTIVCCQKNEKGHVAYWRDGVTCHEGYTEVSTCGDGGPLHLDMNRKDVKNMKANDSDKTKRDDQNTRDTRSPGSL